MCMVHDYYCRRCGNKTLRTLTFECANYSTDYGCGRPEILPLKYTDRCNDCNPSVGVHYSGVNPSIPAIAGKRADVNRNFSYFEPSAPRPAEFGRYAPEPESELSVSYRVVGGHDEQSQSQSIWSRGKEKLRFGTTKGDSRGASYARSSNGSQNSKSKSRSRNDRSDRPDKSRNRDTYVNAADLSSMPGHYGSNGYGPAQCAQDTCGVEAYYHAGYASYAKVSQR